jgi:phage-related protein|tara:strand:+ start:341 stop:748 length:408 start_codon:yes stop_codon:yes gene_type:complete
MAQYQFQITSSDVSYVASAFGSSPAIVTADRGMSRAVVQKVLTAKFGDGYEQRVGDGINTKMDSFSVSFNSRPRKEINAIAAFLDVKTGKSFTFVVTEENEANQSLKVVCEAYNINYDNEDIHSLSGTFRRVYEP